MVRELPPSPCTPSPQPAVCWEAASRAGADPDSSDSQPRAPQGYSWPSHTAPSCCQAWYVPIGLMENKSSAPTWLRDQPRGNKVPFQTLSFFYQLPPRPLPALCPPVCVAVATGGTPQRVPASNTGFGPHQASPKAPSSSPVCCLQNKAMFTLLLDTRQARGGFCKVLNWTCCSSLCWALQCPSPLGHPLRCSWDWGAAPLTPTQLLAAPHPLLPSLPLPFAP